MKLSLNEGVNLSRFLSKSIDYLGTLGAKLRDLKGYRTLAYELIQNADDVPSVSRITFDLRDDALIVENDGIFSDCKAVDLNDCPWKMDVDKKHSCDFHRFRRFGAGDKRNETGTTGAFGIGFTTVYQITDAPELISAGRHWIVRENQPENGRIEECEGCAKCDRKDGPGTKFIFPWANNPDSELRRKWGVDPVSKDIVEELKQHLELSLPLAMRFLKHLKRTEIKVNGKPIQVFDRVDDGESFILSDGGPERDRVFHLFHSDFLDVANELRAQHRSIEEKRSSKITVAIPANLDDPLFRGYLCACLPTEQDEGLPFCINADFFPSNDRKHVVLASNDYQSEWNRAVLREAASLIGRLLQTLTGRLTPESVWKFINAVKETRAHCSDPVFEAFWKEIESHLKNDAVIFTTKGAWVKAADAVSLNSQDRRSISLLESLGCNIVHGDLRPYHNLLTSNKDGAGVCSFDIDMLCDLLRSRGLNRRFDVNDLPDFLRSDAEWDSLWELVVDLFEERKKKGGETLLLQNIALAPGRDGAFWPCGEIYWADEGTISIFDSLGLGIPFLKSKEKFARLVNYCPQFNISIAVDFLCKADPVRLESSWKSGEFDLGRLFEWLETRSVEIKESPDLRQKIAGLRIYPSSGELCALNEVYLPGGYSDPFGLSQLVDLSCFNGRREFLRDMGMQELRFADYVSERLPAAFAVLDVSLETRRRAVRLVADHIGEIRDDLRVWNKLKEVRLVECGDGQFRLPEDCYFDSESIRACLGNHAHFVAASQASTNSVRDLYQFLGVAGRARLEDLVRIVNEVSAGPYLPDSVNLVERIFIHLSKRWSDLPNVSELMPFKKLNWLPARDRTDRWYNPSELYVVFQDYLFETQALFLDMPRPVQSSGTDFMAFLGLQKTPQPRLVVDHLLHCASKQVVVNFEVYTFLNNNYTDPAIAKLLGKKCIRIGSAYWAPEHVFRLENPFGKFRCKLNEEFFACNNLWKQLRLKDVPGWEDALEVIKEIACEFGLKHIPLEDEVYAVIVSCWRKISLSLESGEIQADSLGSLKEIDCVPNKQRMLYKPKLLFFDNRAGLVEKFGTYLRNNVVEHSLDTRSAFGAVGVRSLGSVVKPELLECSDPEINQEMTSNIRSRDNQIGRLLGAQGWVQIKINEALLRLRAVTSKQVRSLELQYLFREFQDTRTSNPELVLAFYDRDSKTVFFKGDNGRIPWGVIARELALALLGDNSEDDPGMLASGIKDVLSAGTSEEADKSLDELGVPRLRISREKEPVDDNSPDAEDVFVQGAEVADNDPGLMDGVPESGGETRDLRKPTKQGDVGSPITTTSMQDDEPRSHEPVTQGAENLDKKAKDSKSSRHRLRSYVCPEGAGLADSSSEKNAADQAHRSRIDRAGINRVLEYEKESGRLPEEMPHNNPGYDIRSSDGLGSVVRYIEVKSLSDKWAIDNCAVLSSEQFYTASSKAEMFWLYVVERADKDDYKVYRIQNPALKADHFMFDDGWSGVAESTET